MSHQSTQTRRRQQSLPLHAPPLLVDELALTASSSCNLRSHQMSVRRSPSHPSTSSSPLSRKEIEQLYIGGCSPLAALTSEEITELIHGVEGAQRSHSRSTASTPCLSASDNAFGGLSSISSAHGGATFDHFERQHPPGALGTRVSAAAAPSPSPSVRPQSSSSATSILNKVRPSSFRRQFTLKVGAPIPTSGCLRQDVTCADELSSCCGFTTASNSRQVVPVDLSTILSAEHRERRELLESETREWERVCFSHARRRQR